MKLNRTISILIFSGTARHTNNGNMTENTELIDVQNFNSKHFSAFNEVQGSKKVLILM
jgi:hypothetical protein